MAWYWTETTMVTNTLSYIVRQHDKVRLAKGSCELSHIWSICTPLLSLCLVGLCMCMELTGTEGRCGYAEQACCHSYACTQQNVWAGNLHTLVFVSTETSNCCTLRDSLPATSSPAVGAGRVQDDMRRNKRLACIDANWHRS